MFKVFGFCLLICSGFALADNSCKSLYDEKKYEEYITACSSLKGAHDYLRLAEASYHEDKSDKDIMDLYDKALAIAPNDAKVLGAKGISLSLLSGRRLLGLGYSEEALEYLNKSLEIEPNNMRVLIYKANSLINLMRYDEALELFEKKLDENFLTAEGLNVKAQLFRSIEREEEALALYNKALSLDPNHLFSLIDKASLVDSLYLDADAEVKVLAEKELDVAITKRGYIRALISMAFVYCKQYEYVKCFAISDKALKLNPNNVSTMLSAATMYKLGNLDDKVLELYDRAYLASHNYQNKAVVLRVKTIFFLDKENYAEALAINDKALKLKPNEYYFLWIKGQLLYNMERYNESLIFYDKAIKVAPNKQEVASMHKGKGLVYDEMKNYTKALDEYDKALDTPSKRDKVEVYRTIAYVYSEYLNNNEQAIIEYNKGLAFDPKNTDILHDLGVTLVNLKRYEEGIAFIDKAILYTKNKYDKELYLNTKRRLKGY